MAFEPSVSPEPSSGRASPVPRKWRTQLGSEDPPNKDKSFRRYASGVDRSLSLFETALQEWADYISFLSRLLKSLQAHPSTIATIPSKAIVAKRLAQCLNPSLPSGVHQKTLEVYAFIFSMIGKETLSRDLPLYLPGLSSTLSFASLSVRTPFLELFEKYLLVLDPRSLRPAIKAIILALLPGLEEETSEDFEGTLQLLDGFKKAIRPSHAEDLGQNNTTGDEFFWQCFFLAAITSNNRRLGALAYLIRTLPKLGEPYPNEPIDASNGSRNWSSTSKFKQLSELVTSPEPGLLLRCFAAGLADEQLLTQRGFLDLLVTHLPLHSHVLQQRVKAEDLELLITAAAGVVSRREMSLNRRLWTWLLGPEQTSHNHDGAESPTSVTGYHSGTSEASRTRYFEEFGQQPLTRALLKLIAKDPLNSVERARPFRICLSLMDRWEIGGLIVPDIFLAVVNSVRRYQSQAATKAEFSEVLRSASVFFDGVESGLIWGEITRLVAEAVGAAKVPTAERVDKLSLVSFIVANFNVREEEMLLIHAPLTALTTLTLLEDAQGILKQSGEPPTEVVKLSLSIAMTLVELIPDRAFQSRPPNAKSNPATADKDSLEIISNADVLQGIKQFYVHDQGNLEAASPPLSSHDTSKLLLLKASSIMCQSMLDSVSNVDVTIKTKLLVTILAKAPRIGALDASRLLSSMQNQLQNSAQLSFTSFTSLVSLATNMCSISYISDYDLSNLVEPLVRHAWSFLSASQPKYHVETVRCLWQLQMALPLSNHEIEAAICSVMVERDINGTFAVRNADPGRSFAILWTHTLQDNAHLDRRASKASHVEAKVDMRPARNVSFEVMLGRPLFLLLDALLDERTQLFMTVRTWLQNLVGVEKLFQIIVAKLSSFTFLYTASPEEIQSSTKGRQFYGADHDLDQCLYYLRTLSNILRWSSDGMWATLARISVSGSQDIHKIIGRDEDVSLLEFFLHVCLRAISGSRDSEQLDLEPRVSQFHRTALNLLHQILLSPYSLPMAELKLESFLIDRLFKSLEESDPFIQVLLLDVVFATLRLRNSARPIPPPLSPTAEFKRPMTQETPSSSRLSLATEQSGQNTTPLLPPPATLIKCLQAGLSSPSSRPVLDSWVSFLTECLPLYSDTIFQNLIPLVETLCAQVGNTFKNLQQTFKASGSLSETSMAPESTLISLLNGLELVLARGHDRLLQEESRTLAAKSPEQPQGFFGNMASGLFTSETPQSRTASANNRLTVLLSFQDAVRICFVIWSWGGDDITSMDSESSASFNFTSLRMRNRARRLLEHLFAAEALECLETVVEIWRTSSTSRNGQRSPAVFNLLHVLDGSRPKHTIPAIFNAIYSRTNPSALDPSRKSTMTSSLSDTDLVVFLVDYARSLEDDTMDEIWTDCMTFLKDLLANPFPHRQTLPCLLEFAAILGEKVDNTNFGEQRRMRRELADLFLRLLTAIFTTRPMGFLESTSDVDRRAGSSPSRIQRSDDVVGILASIAPNLPKILVEADRVLNAANTISTSLVGPTFKSKSFPDNVQKSTLVLLYQLARLPQTQKSWKKDLGDAFNDPRFFGTTVALVDSDWLPLLKQWTLSDKARMPELLSRLLPPTTAGIVFGVGATSARLEADRKTQLNLRRIAVLVLATMQDNFVTDLPVMQEKIVELLSATTTSSPSSTTRADIYLLLRALVLKTSAVHLATLWPIINSELHTVLASAIAPDHSAASETYNNDSILQACKLLDTLLCIAPDDFQLHEWLFITDTIDAVYRPSEFDPIALIDEISEELGSTALGSAVQTESLAMQAGNSSSRRLLLGPGGISDVGTWERKDELVGKVLRPFFSQLSIFAFESTYSMSVPDWEACRMSLLRDMFDEKSIVKAL